MIVLPPGEPKYLLLDPREIARNAERAKIGAPIVRVAEVQSEGHAVSRAGYSVRVLGTVALAYSQRTPLFKIRLAPDQEDQAVYAAYVTTDEVRLATEPGEDLGDVEEPAAVAPTPTDKVKKQK